MKKPVKSATAPKQVKNKKTQEDEPV